MIVTAVITLLTALDSPVYADTTDNIFASRMAIERITGREITDFWAMEFGERLSPDGKFLSTKGAVELNGDGVKRLFWCSFDAKTMQLLRLKIGSQLLYSR